MRFVDTNVLLYAISRLPDEAEKQRRALKILDRRDLAVSVQTLQEFYYQATRAKGPWRLTHEEATGFVRSVERFPVQPVTVEVLHDAFRLTKRFRINYWDAAILAAARIAGCNILYTEDLNDGQDYDGVRVVNPFTG